MEQFPNQSFLQIIYSGLITSTRYTGVQSTYGPDGNFRGGRDGLEVILANGNSGFIGAPGNDTARLTVVDSELEQGTVYAKRATSTGDGICLGGVPCYTYSGPQTVTVQYIRVGLHVSAGPDTVAFVGGATGVAAAPTYMFRGHTLPYTMTDWRWIPRGLQGTTKPCSGPQPRA